MKKQKTLLLVGGGTGGHAAPILAIYDQLKKTSPDLNMVVVGMGSKEEKEFYSSIPDYISIKSGKLNRLFALENFKQIADFIFGFFQSFGLLGRLKPVLIFSKGGYVSLPIVMAARILRIPYMLHESDIVMGKVNEYMSKGSNKIFTCFPKEFYSKIDQTKLIQTGPVLRVGFSSQNQNGDKNIFGFHNDKPVLFVTGGSQGALNLSKKLIEAAPDLFSNFNIIHQAGKHSMKVSYDFYTSLNQSQKEQYYLKEFFGKEDEKDMMLEAIKIADLVISRAGSTIAELAIMGKPMLLVPWKYSSRDHQAKNAKFFADKEAAAVISEDDLTADALTYTINDLFANDRAKLKLISNNAESILPDNGLDIICGTIEKEIGD